MPSNTPPETESSIVITVLIALGTLLSLGVICGSVLLNFRMAYRSADTEFDAWIYGLSIGLGDGLKALMPFVVVRAFARQNWLAVAAGAIFFTIMSAYSFTAAIGFAAQHRMSKSIERLGSAERSQDLHQRYTEVQQARHTLGQQRPATIIREERNVLLLTPIPGRQTVGELSASCTLNRAEAKTICEQWRQRGIELASAVEAERLDAELAALRAKLDSVPAVSNPDDPQTMAISRLGRWFEQTFPKEDIQLALSLLLALVIETGSGFGLFLTASLRERRTEEGSEVAAPMERLGTVEDYACARLAPSRGATVTGAALYTDYLSWCRQGGVVALAAEPFLAAFGELAAELGIGIGVVDNGPAYHDVGFDNQGG
jgi:hypothetical protein